MNIGELSSFSDRVVSFLKTQWRSEDATEFEPILRASTKLTEEIGELNAEILASAGYQRAEKMQGKSPEDLEAEFADVLIATCVLAREMNVDIESALARKMKTVEERYKI